jgi:hypothetical protein
VPLQVPETSAALATSTKTIINKTALSAFMRPPLQITAVRRTAPCASVP